MRGLPSGLLVDATDVSPLACGLVLPLPHTTPRHARLRPSPKETRERLCPHSLSLAVTPPGHVTADRTGIRSAYRCRGCSKDFRLLAVNRPERLPRRSSSGARTTTTIASPTTPRAALEPSGHPPNRSRPSHRIPERHRGHSRLAPRVRTNMKWEPPLSRRATPQHPTGRPRHVRWADTICPTATGTAAGATG